MALGPWSGCPSEACLVVRPSSPWADRQVGHLTERGNFYEKVYETSA